MRDHSSARPSRWVASAFGAARASRQRTRQQLVDVDALVEDRSLEVAQLGTGVDSELLGQQLRAR